jgi:hypothetical protein
MKEVASRTLLLSLFLIISVLLLLSISLRIIVLFL